MTALENFLFEAKCILPEAILLLGVCLVLFVDMFVGLRRSREVSFGIAGLSIAFSLQALVCEHLHKNVLFLIYKKFFKTNISLIEFEKQISQKLDFFYFNKFIILDSIALIFKSIFLLATAFVILFSMRSKELEKYRGGEYYALMLGAVFGACLLVSSSNVLLFILSFETLSLCSYVLVSFAKNRKDSAEAGLKFVLYGAIASGIMLFGFSYLYGITQTLNISDMMFSLYEQIRAHGANRIAILFSLIFVFTGLAFKISAVPFHFWCPDVYQGAPTPIVAFLSVVSKAAGFSAIVRLLWPWVYSGPVKDFLIMDTTIRYFLGAIAIITMSFANLVAIKQKNIKRLFGYSSIAHAGYMLMALSVFNTESIQAMLVYLIIYMFINLGAFFVIILLSNNYENLELNNFRGFASKSPFIFICLFIFLIALVGLPPTAGFSAKFLVFSQVLKSFFYTYNSGMKISWFYFSLLIAGGINTVISLYYYMEIIKNMAFLKVKEGEENKAVFKIGFVDYLICGAFVIPVILLLNFSSIEQIAVLFFA